MKRRAAAGRRGVVEYPHSGVCIHMTRDTVLCKARSMPREIPLEICVPNPAHPACKQCDSARIDDLKPEDHARLRSHDSSEPGEDEELFEEPPDIEPGEEDFEEFEED
jgi:hypothetical protein